MDTELGRARRRLRRRAATIGFALWAVCAPAAAQNATAEDIASARVLGTEGVRLADGGDCKAAVVKLTAAEKLYHAPTTLERLGECEVKLGQLIAGTEALNRVTREVLPPNPPAAFVAAEQRAAAALGPAMARIGKLRIHIEGAPADQVTVSVDDDPVPSALWDADRPTDPGPHEVKASARGYKRAAQAVTVPEGGNASAALILEPDPSAPAVAAPPPAETSQPSSLTPVGSPSSTGPQQPAAPSTGARKWPAFVAYGVGAVGVGLGAVFGIMALGTKSTLDAECPGKVCPESARADLDTLNARATLANAAFAVGAVGLAVGTVLLFTMHGGESPSAQPRAARLTPWLSVGGSGLQGSFE